MSQELSPVSDGAQDASAHFAKNSEHEPFVNNLNENTEHFPDRESKAVTSPISNDIAPSVSAVCAIENESVLQAGANTFASADKPVVNLNVAVNSLDALMSAVSNLNSIMDPRAKVVKKALENERKNSIAARLVVSAEPSKTSDTLLPDSKLPLANRVFAYIDALREHEALFDEEQIKEDKDCVNSKLIEARTKARTVVSQAVSMGVAELDYVPTDVEVQSDTADEFDPFAGGSTDALNVVAETVPSGLQEQGFEKASSSQDDGTLSQNEVLSIVSAVHDDIKTRAEDDSAGEREKSVENIKPHSEATLNPDPKSNEEKTASLVATVNDHAQADANAVSSSNCAEAVAETKHNDTLYADGVALSSDLVEGLREGESVEEMLRRVQQTALEQLRQDDAINGPHANIQDNLEDSATDNKDIIADVALNAEHKGSRSNTDFSDVKSNASENMPQDREKQNECYASLPPEEFEQNTTNDDLAGISTAEIKKDPESIDSEDHKHNDNAVLVVLLDDPYEDEKAYHDETLIEGTSLNDAILATKKHDVCTENTANEGFVDVVGELLRSQLQALDGKASAQILPSVKSAESSENVAGSNTAFDSAVSLNSSDPQNISSSDLASLDKEISEQAMSYEEPLTDADLDDEEEDVFDSQQSYPSSDHDFDEKDAQFDAGATPGIQVLPDGRTDDVPIAERMERERIENADKIAQGRALEPDDFIADVIGSDPWGCDFVAAGYSEGAVFSALCASVRCIDPTDPNHWIVVMSDTFKIFAIDPNFVNGLMERFSSLKKHHIEISIQLSSGFPQGSPRDLCVKAFGVASEKARHDLSSDPAVQQIAQLAGADLRYCAVKLFALS